MTAPGSSKSVSGRRRQKEKEDSPPPHLQLTSRRWRFISRQLEGNYPHWRQVVPNGSGFSTWVEIDPAGTEQLRQIIERMPCHNQTHMTMGLQVTGTTVALLGKAPGADRWTRVEIETGAVRGLDVTILLDRRIFSTALKFGLTTIAFSDPMAPIRFSHEGRQMIVMPIRPEATPAPQVTATAEESHGTDAVEPVSSDAEQPAAEEAAQPETQTMKTATTTAPAAATTNGSNGHEPTAEKPALELALDQIETTKTALRTVREGLHTLAETLRQVQREQKTSDKEVQSVRTTLERLQGMKL